MTRAVARKQRRAWIVPALIAAVGVAGVVGWRVAATMHVATIAAPPLATPTATQPALAPEPIAAPAPPKLKEPPKLEVAPPPLAHAAASDAPRAPARQARARGASGPSASISTPRCRPDEGRARSPSLLCLGVGGGRARRRASSSSAACAATPSGATTRPSPPSSAATSSSRAPDFLYALGQAQRMQGDCRAAVASYRAYLRTSPPERSAAPARQNLERCERELANAPPPPSRRRRHPPSSRSRATPPPAVVVTTAPPRRRARDDRAAAILAGLGGAALVAGAVLWGVGEAGARSLADATTYDQYAAHGADADAFGRERIAGIVTLAVGGALVVVAVARWSWLYTHR